MKRFYLFGHNNFGNRGCEALVRTTTKLLIEEFGNVEVLIPSYRPDLDKKQWPDAPRDCCRFVKAMPYPIELKVMNKLRNIIPFIINFYLPHIYFPKDIAADISSCDVFLLIGGDNLSLDYGIESLIWYVRAGQYAQRMGKRIMVWGASIGPFTSQPVIEKFAANFLQRVDAITVRETISMKYLSSINVKGNVTLAADSAFLMAPQQVDCTTFWPVVGAEGVLGLNISPLIQQFRSSIEHRQVVQKEIAQFIKHVLDESHLSILLIPHVDPLDGSVINSDSQFMREILKMIEASGERIKLAPGNLNAAQLKYVISQCKYFIGARTHATIGALSSFIPTVSIAYSIKAKGINQDLFGNDDFVLEAPLLDETSLKHSLQMLIQNEKAIKDILLKRIPQWCKSARLSPQCMAKIIG